MNKDFALAAILTAFVVAVVFYFLYQSEIRHVPEQFDTYRYNIICIEDVSYISGYKTLTVQFDKYGNVVTCEKE